MWATWGRILHWLIAKSPFSKWTIMLTAYLMLNITRYVDCCWFHYGMNIKWSIIDDTCVIWNTCPLAQCSQTIALLGVASEPNSTVHSSSRQPWLIICIMLPKVQSSLLTIQYLLWQNIPIPRPVRHRMSGHATINQNKHFSNNYIHALLHLYSAYDCSQSLCINSYCCYSWHAPS